MATFFKTLTPLLCSIALLLTAATASSPPEITSFAYNFNGVDPGGLTYQGDANFQPSTTPNLRLTKADSSDSVGRVLYTKAIPFWDEESKACFQTDLKFIITPNTDGQDPADGLVFFITGVNSSVGSGGGYFGVFDDSGQNPSLFAVEFDTFINDDFDPSFRHVGIDIQSVASVNTTEVDNAIIGTEVSASIKYNANTNLISVRGSAGGNEFQVSFMFDLRAILPQQVQVGISAATGALAAFHDVISWSFCSSFYHI